MRRVTTFCILVSCILLLLHGARSEHAFCQNAREIPKPIENEYQSTKLERPMSLYSESVQKKEEKECDNADIPTDVPSTIPDNHVKHTRFPIREIKSSRRLSYRRNRTSGTINARILSRRNLNLRRSRRYSDTNKRTRFTKTRAIRQTLSINRQRRQNRPLRYRVQKIASRRLDKNTRRMRNERNRKSRRVMNINDNYSSKKSTARSQGLMRLYRIRNWRRLALAVRRDSIRLSQRVRKDNHLSQILYRRRIRIFETLPRRTLSTSSRQRRLGERGVATVNFRNNRVAERRLRYRSKRSQRIIGGNGSQNTKVLVGKETRGRRIRQQKLTRRRYGMKIKTQSSVTDVDSEIRFSTNNFKLQRRLRTSKMQRRIDRRNPRMSRSNRKSHKIAYENHGENIELKNNLPDNTIRIRTRFRNKRRDIASDTTRRMSAVGIYRRIRNNLNNKNSERRSDKADLLSESTKSIKAHRTNRRSRHMRDRHIHEMKLDDESSLHRRSTYRSRRSQSIRRNSFVNSQTNSGSSPGNNLLSVKRRTMHIRENRRIRSIYRRSRQNQQTHDRSIRRQNRRVRHVLNLDNTVSINDLHGFRVAGISSRRNQKRRVNRNRRDGLNRRNVIRYNRQITLGNEDNSEIRQSRRFRSSRENRKTNRRNRRMSRRSLQQNLIGLKFEYYPMENGQSKSIQNKSSEASATQSSISTRRLKRSKETRNVVLAKNENQILGNFVMNTDYKVKHFSKNTISNRRNKIRRSRRDKRVIELGIHYARHQIRNRSKRFADLENIVATRAIPESKRNKRTRQRRNRQQNTMFQLEDTTMKSNQRDSGQQNHRSARRRRSVIRLSKHEAESRQAHFALGINSRIKTSSSQTEFPFILDTKNGYAVEKTTKNLINEDTIRGALSLRKGHYQHEESVIDFSSIGRGMMFGLLGFLGTRMRHSSA